MPLCKVNHKYITTIDLDMSKHGQTHVHVIEQII